MRKFGFYLRLLVSFLCVCGSSPSFSAEMPSVQHEWGMGRWYEGGVVNRLQIEYFGNFHLDEFFSLEVGTSLSLLEQVGPSLFGFLGKAAFPNAKSELVIGIQYERWPTWKISENRFEFYWTFSPEETFNLSFGLAYRAVQYDVISFLPFANWNSDPNGELNILYRINWMLYRFPPLRIFWLIWDYDHMRLFNMDNVHFTLKTDWTIDRSLSVYLSGTSGVTGVSGGVLTWSQSILSFGLVYGL